MGTMLQSSLLIALLLLVGVAHATLTEMQAILQREPSCQVCTEVVGRLLATEDPDLLEARYDHYCKFIAREYQTPFYECMENREGTVDEICRNNRACLTNCQWCNAKADLAQESGDFQPFCTYMSDMHDTDSGACVDGLTSYKDKDTFCEAVGSCPEDSDLVIYPSMSPAVLVPCFHGEITRTYTETGYCIDSGEGESDEYCDWFPNSEAFESCLCETGYTGVDCTQSYSRAFDPEVVLLEDPEDDEDPYAKYRMDGGSSSGTSGDCDYSWHYFQDSDMDGVTLGAVGDLSAHEYYGMAWRQTPEVVVFAFNLNLPPTGDEQRTCVVSMGDLLVNFETEDGVIRPLPEVSAAHQLYAVRHDQTNDADVPELGVYSGVIAKSVTATNNGFTSFDAYEQFVTQEAGGHTAYGDGIDQAYYGTVPLNDIGSGVRVGETSVQYYYTEDIPDDMGLDWGEWARGWYTRIVTVPRRAFPPQKISFMAHVAEECFNDVMGVRGELCGAPSISSSPTPTGSRTPSESITPTQSLSNSDTPTRTATVSSTATRTVTPSISMSISAAPSFDTVYFEEDEYVCQCFDLFNMTANTIVLHNFQGFGDTEGKLFIGGNAVLSSYSVGDKLKDSNGTDDHLIVGGKLQFNSGRVYGGNIVVNSMRSEVTDLAAFPSSEFNSIFYDSDRYDWEIAADYYEQMSLNLAEFRPSGFKSFMSDRRLILSRRDGAYPEFFLVGCDELNLATSVELDGMSRTQPAIINVYGRHCNLTNSQFKVANPELTVFNFYEALELYVGGTAVEGSILAPRAHVTGVGVIRGQIVAGSWSNVQQNNVPCLLCLGDLSLDSMLEHEDEVAEYLTKKVQIKEAKRAKRLAKKNKNNKKKSALFPWETESKSVKV